MMRTAKRLGDVQEYYFSRKLRQIAELNAQGQDILNLGIGSPDRMPDESVIDTLVDQSRIDSNHGYQSYKGIPELRNAFTEWYDRYFKVKLDPEREILPLIGSKEGIFHISMTYLDEGDEVLVPNPGYPSYAAASKLTGATIRHYELTESSSWLPDLSELSKQDLSRVKIMWVNYPNMPTGTNGHRDLFQELRSFGEKHDILICNDNPYAFILNDQPSSILEAGINDHVLELNSLSKSHNMAGWRIGMIAGSSYHIDNILRFKSNVDSGMFKPSQLAAVKALSLDAEWYEEVNGVYQRRRELAWRIMSLLNCSYDENQVGMFVWAKVPEQKEDVEKWMDEILLGSRVFITPGFIFGSNGDRFIRISLCSKTEVFEEAISRIENFLTS